jgi:hypothetical protein
MPGSARLVDDGLGPPAIARARQHGFQLILDQLFNEPADPSTALSIGSNQLSKSRGTPSSASCAQSIFVVSLVMAWSPARRFNAG